MGADRGIASPSVRRRHHCSAAGQRLRYFLKRQGFLAFRVLAIIFLRPPFISVVRCAHMCVYIYMYVCTQDVCVCVYIYIYIYLYKHQDLVPIIDVFI